MDVYDLLCIMAVLLLWNQLLEVWLLSQRVYSL